MPTVTIHQAKTHLSRLIKAALAGEEVVICRGSTPLVVLRPIDEPAALPRRLGEASDLVAYMADDFDAPMADFAGDDYGPPDAS